MYYKDFIRDLPPYKPAKLIARQGAGVVKLSSNENPLGPSPRAVAAIQAAAMDVYRYPDSGSLELRQRLSARFDLTPEMIICSNGSDEMVLLLCLAFLREGDEAIMAMGSFISYYLRTLEVEVRLCAYRCAITPTTSMPWPMRLPSARGCCLFATPTTQLVR